jgi:hypothetical protein
MRAYDKKVNLQALGNLADGSHHPQASLSTTKTSIRSQVIHGEVVGTHERNAQASFLLSRSGGLKGACVCHKKNIAIAAACDKAHEARDEDGVC